MVKKATICTKTAFLYIHDTWCYEIMRAEER